VIVSREKEADPRVLQYNEGKRSEDIAERELYGVIRFRQKEGTGCDKRREEKGKKC